VQAWQKAGAAPKLWEDEIHPDHSEGGQTPRRLARRLRVSLGMSKRFVYVLRSLRVPERRYVGLTADVEARLKAHNAGMSPFTAKYRPWAVTVCIAFADERNASRFERYLKGPSGRAFARRHFDVGES
jgi:predicted GIY-YIG superfamily endonuclease